MIRTESLSDDEVPFVALSRSLNAGNVRPQKEFTVESHHFTVIRLYWLRNQILDRKRFDRSPSITADLKKRVRDSVTSDRRVVPNCHFFLCKIEKDLEWITPRRKR